LDLILNIAGIWFLVMVIILPFTLSFLKSGKIADKYNKLSEKEENK